MGWLFFLLILPTCGIDNQDREDPSPNSSNGATVENGTIAVAFAESATYTEVSGYLVGFEATHPATESAAGGYEIANLTPGLYDLIVLGKNAEGTEVGIRINSVRVSSGKTKALSEVQLSPLGNVPGQALLQDTPTKSDGVSVKIPGTSYQATTDAAGNYQITSVPAGIHKVLLEKSGYFPGTVGQVTVPSGTAAAMPNFEMVPRIASPGLTLLRINGGDTVTDNRTVNVNISAPEYITQMLLSENSNFTGVEAVPFTSQSTYQFSTGGVRKLYVRLLDSEGETRLSTLSAEILIDLQTWEQGEVSGIQSYSVPAIARSGNYIMVWQNGSGDLCRIDGSTIACTALPTASAPKTRTAPSLFGLPGDKFILFGGKRGASDRNDGSVFDVKGNSWQRVAFGSVPAPRSDYSAAIVGSHFFYWGGAVVGAPVDTGGVYDTVAERWTATVKTKVPFARAKAVAVALDSDRVWVWGGRAKPGGIYSIGGIRWTSISQVGAPSLRVGCSAVLVDGKVFIWGGNGLTSGNPLGDGALYDPASDKWKPVSATDAPLARAFHTTVAADSSVVIWGGETSPGSPVAGGAIYSLATDTWTTISESGAPGARSKALGFWTGAVVGLFGGLTGGNKWSDDFYLFSPGE